MSSSRREVTVGHGGQADERLKIALASMHANMRAFYRLLGERSQGGTVVERDGILAAVVPSCPNRSIVNAVVYEDAGALAAIRDDLEAFYDQAGVRAWTVWVPEADRATAQLLERAGHRLDARPRAMTLEISEVDFGGAGGIDWERTNDLAVVAAINESAYGLQAGEFAEAITAMADAPVAFYLAHLEGRPAACLGALDEAGDCGIYFVATMEAARGHGLASALMRQAIIDARLRGCKTSSLQATRAGYPLYRRVGYLDLCAIDMWERCSAD